MTLEINHLSFKYEQDVLKDISLKLDQGSFISLLGVNGSGKSTLLKNMIRILSPYEGNIVYFGKDMKDFTRNELARTISYVSQTGSATRVRVYDSILIGRKPYIEYLPKEKDHQIVSELMDYLKLNPMSLKYTDELSGGELQKVHLARALAQEPKVLLLDEPTSALDIKNQLEVMDMVLKYCKEKKITTIVSIHDINLSLRYADRYILLKDKKIYAYGDRSILTPDNLGKVYGLYIKMYELDGFPFIIPFKEKPELERKE